MISGETYTNTRIFCGALSGVFGVRPTPQNRTLKTEPLATYTTWVGRYHLQKLNQDATAIHARVPKRAVNVHCHSVNGLESEEREREGVFSFVFVSASISLSLSLKSETQRQKSVSGVCVFFSPLRTTVCQIPKEKTKKQASGGNQQTITGTPFHTKWAYVHQGARQTAGKTTAG